MTWTAHPGLLLTVAALAVARITRLLVVDRMPFGAVRRRVEKAATLAPTRGVWTPAGVQQQMPWWAELVHCSWCVGVWVAAGWTALVWAWPQPMGWVSAGLAAATVAGLVAEHSS